MSANKCQIGSSLQIANDSAVYAVLNDVSKTYGNIHPYLATFICVTGVFMNISCIVVLTRPSMIISPINCLLTAIAVCDAITMTSTFNFLVRSVTNVSCPSKYSYEWRVTLLLHSNVTVVAHTVSIWLTVAMAIVRACTVKQAWGGTGRTGRASVFFCACITAFVLLTVCLLNVPTALSFTVEPRPAHLLCPGLFNASQAYGDGNGSSPAASLYLYMSALSELATSRDCILLKASFWISGVLFKMVPCILLTFFIGVLIVILAEVRRRRARLRLNSEANRTDKTTLMLIVLLTVFLFSELPQGLLLIASGVYDYKFRYKVLNKLGDLMDILSLINSAANFVVYFAMSQKFREVFCRTLLPMIGDYRIVYKDNRLTFYATEGDTTALRAMNGCHRPSRAGLETSHIDKDRRTSRLFDRSHSIFEQRSYV